MNPQSALPWIISIILFFAVPTPAPADGCMKCHRANEVVVDVPDVDPIVLTFDGDDISINLTDAYAFHGHECPGLTIAYLAVQYGLQILFDDRIPDRSDLLISSRTPARGPMDLIDLIMKGNDPASRTWSPVGMKKARDGFFFTIFSKSTFQAVDVRLKPELFPLDFFKLKKKQKNKIITTKEWDTLHGYMKEIITRFPGKPMEALFGRPQPYQVLWWGALEPGETDRRIRALRQKQKRKKASD